MFSHFNAAIAKIPVAPIEGGSFRFGHGADRCSQIDVDCHAFDYAGCFGWFRTTLMRALASQSKLRRCFRSNAVAATTRGCYNFCFVLPTTSPTVGA
jgi:hypothetical protein